jgi:pyruvate/2-oxoglutarate dehydrogenase complex dihydrolipoamide dehydrogenase (E3) component
MASAPKNPKAKVTLVCGDKKLLPVLREAIGQTAQQYLKRVGCEVLYNTKVVSANKLGESEDAKTNVELSNGESIEADIYIDATGSRPNTGFLPKEWLGDRNKVATNPKTLRVDNPSAQRVYVVGDVGSHTRGGVMGKSTFVQTDVGHMLISYRPIRAHSRSHDEPEDRPDRTFYW